MEDIIDRDYLQAEKEYKEYLERKKLNTKCAIN